MNSWFMFHIFQSCIAKKARAGEKTCHTWSQQIESHVFFCGTRGSSTVLQCQWLRTWDFTKLTSSFNSTNSNMVFMQKCNSHRSVLNSSLFYIRANSFAADSEPLQLGSRGILSGLPSCWFSPNHSDFGWHFVTTLGHPQKQSPSNKWRVSCPWHPNGSFCDLNAHESRCLKMKTISNTSLQLLHILNGHVRVVQKVSQSRLKLSSIFFWDGKRNPFSARDLEIM